MSNINNLESFLRNHLPAELHNVVPALARLLHDIVSGQVEAATAQSRIAADEEFTAALRELNGRKVETDGALISFEGAQTGDVYIEVAGRDIVKVSPEPHPNLTPLRTIELDELSLDRELGRNVFTTVLLGRHAQIQADVAIKMLDPRLLNDKTFVNRFILTTRRVANLKHPGIIQVYDYGVYEQRPVVVMEFAAEGTLADLLQRQRRLSWPEALPIVQAVGQALAYAHEHQIIHRDLKPENILFDRQLTPKIGNFGLSYILRMSSISTETRANPETELYSAPELGKRGRPSAASDQYALACITCELLLGRAGFRGNKSILEMTNELPADVPPAARAVLNKALSPNPNDRFTSVAAFVQALGKIASPPLLPLSLAAAGLIVVLGIALTALMLGLQPSPPEINPWDRLPTAPATPTSPSLVVPNPERISAELASALRGEYAGETVRILAQMAPADKEFFLASLKTFTESTKINIEYIDPAGRFENVVEPYVNAREVDIVDFPQPGLLMKFAREGKVVDAKTIVNPSWLQDNYRQAWRDLAQMPGLNGQPIQAGVWHRASVKSLVWYPKGPFEVEGYAIPETWDGLMQLTEQISNEQEGTPWCIGIEADLATGWPATDWLEDLMLRISVDGYDKWVRHEIPFASPEVRMAAARMEQIWFEDRYVYNGTASILHTPFATSPLPMFNNPPGCWLHKQANFITTVFAQGGKEPGVDYDVFYFPPIDTNQGKPVLVGGDLMAMVNDRPAVRAVMAYFTTGISIKDWVNGGGVVSPHEDREQTFANDVVTKVHAILDDATELRFDGSDLMPAEIGTATFYQAMTDYVSSRDLEAALRRIDEDWPSQQ